VPDVGVAVLVEGVQVVPEVEQEGSFSASYVQDTVETQYGETHLNNFEVNFQIPI
jgi:hypothetical protein